MARILNLELSNYCNTLCKWCGRNYMKRKIGQIDLVLFRKIIEKVKDRQNDIYLQLYGEPLTYPYLIEAIKICEDNNIKPGFFTNGKLLNDEMINNLAHCDMEEICVTMNQFKPLEQVEKLLNKCNFRIRPIYLDVPKEMQTSLSRLEFAKWCFKNKIRPELARYDCPIFEKMTDCCLKDAHGECYLRKINAVNVLYDGRLVTCAKDYDGKTVVGNLNDLDNFEYENKQCPFT